jgi:hypothetical protein
VLDLRPELLALLRVKVGLEGDVGDGRFEVVLGV